MKLGILHLSDIHFRRETPVYEQLTASRSSTFPEFSLRTTPIARLSRVDPSICSPR